MSAFRLSSGISGRICALFTVAALLSASAYGQSVVGRNTNAVGPTPDGFYRGIPHYQENEAHCDRNPLLPSNIVCMTNGYGGADDMIGDAWPFILETQDNTRTWQSRFATGSAADPATNLDLGFGADPIVVCWPGGCGGFFIASNRSAGGGTGGGIYMQLMPEFNIETGFRHFSEAGPRVVQLGTGDNFLDKIDAKVLIETGNPGTIPVTMNVDKGNGVTELVTRNWPNVRIIVVYASINSSNQNIRIFSTFSDNYGLNWSPPKQVANTTGVDTGVAVDAIGDTVFYAYRQFEDPSGGEINAVYGAVSTNRGRTVRKPFVVVDNLCAFDQPTLPIASDPNPPPWATVASRTNNFVDVSNDGGNFVMVLAERQRNLQGGCLTEPFDYPAGSRVLVTKAGSNGKNWSTPVEIAPHIANDPRFPQGVAPHSFKFMPAVDCELSLCQAIWYDSINDSIRNIGYLHFQSQQQGAAPGWADAVNDFINFPLFGDFFLPVTGVGVVQFRRTADIFTRQFKVNGNSIAFQDPAPVQVSKYQLAAISPSTVVEVEQNSFNLKQYKSNTAGFMGDYIGLASKKIRSLANPSDPTGPPIYESNSGIDPNNPQLKPSWFAYWTDTRNARGTLYTQNIEDPLPFETTPMASMMGRVEEVVPDADVDSEKLPGERKLSAEGVEDSDPGDPLPLECVPPVNPPAGPGDTLMADDNQNRIKDADIYGALIEVPATAWVQNASKGLGIIGLGNIELQRTYVIAARNEEQQAGKSFRFRIMNQPVGFLPENEARASWEQLPFENFDNQGNPPLEEIDEDVGPQSSVSVSLFVVSKELVNPVTVNVYEVNGSVETLVETLEVNGTLEAGDLITPAGAPSNVNFEEIHNPFVFAPDDFLDIDYSNPDVWNPDVWNPDVWNPDVWNPDVWNPDVWNPDVWNPDVWNVGLTDADMLDNPEIPSPELGNLPREPDGTVAKFDVQFGVENIGNTLTPYSADFAANSPLVRQLLADGQVKTQIIVWEEAESDSFQACGADIIAGDISAGENRILAVANNADLLTLKIPDITKNRFGSVTYNSEPGDKVQITIRFMGLENTIRLIAPELAKEKSISYVVTSQAANTLEIELDVGEEQVIEDLIPPDLTINRTLPVMLSATVVSGQIGAILPADLVTASKVGEPEPVVSCEDEFGNAVTLGLFAPLRLGETNLICSATSMQNGVAGSIEFTVIVQDLDPPDLGPMPADITVERDALDGATINDYVPPTAEDDIDSDVDVACSIPPLGFAPFDPPGPTQTEITCTATDDSGNTDSDSFFATVEDKTPPDLTIPTSASDEATDPAGTTVTFAPIPSATDIGAVSVTCTAFNPAVEVQSGDLFPIGTTTVECTATDDANNSTTDTFDVTVTDNTIIGSGISSNKKTVKAGSVAGFNWAWEDSSGNPVDVGEGNQDIEAWLQINSDCSVPGPDLINEDPGSSGIRRAPNGGWQFNWQTVYNAGHPRDGEPLDPGQYCVSVRLMSDPSQRQTTDIRVRR